MISAFPGKKQDADRPLEIAIVIPVFNEELTLADVVRDFAMQLPDATIVVVDNNSLDATRRIAHEALARVARGRLLVETTRGKAAAVRKAFTCVDADIYVMVDGDSTYPAEAIHDMLHPVVAGTAEMVVGDRHANNGYVRANTRRFHNFGNQFVKHLINMLFKSNLNDILSGYRVFSRRFVKNFPILSDGFALETELTLHALANSFNVVEIPIDSRERPPGSTSKLNTYLDGFRVTKLVFTIFKDYHPLSFFTLASLLLFILGCASGTPVLLEFIRTRIILHVPLSILATGLMIFSLISVSIGVLLDTVAKNHRFHYALKLLEYSERHYTSAASQECKNL